MSEKYQKIWLWVSYTLKISLAVIVMYKVLQWANSMSVIRSWN